MTLKSITIILGLMATLGGLIGIFRPVFVKRTIKLFPRSVIPAWILTALCCWLGTREAMAMNMGVVDVIKPYIPFIAFGVFAASVFYMKELLAARALGGFLLLISVPIMRIAAMDSSPMRQVVVVVLYILIVYGIVLLMSPWWFRKLYEPIIDSDRPYKLAAIGKAVVGVLLLLLGLFVY